MKTDSFEKSSEIPYKDLCKVHKRRSKLRGCSWFTKIVCLAKLDLVSILLFKRKLRSSLISFLKACQVTCHSFHATIVCKKVMLLRTVMLENIMFLKGL